ncbi:MAG: recombinase family protein [Balneola sp.]
MKPKAYSYIRFSTPEQIKGDSLRRQLEDTKNYVLNETELELDESLIFRDLGVSAKDSINSQEGALGQFLQLVKNEKIAKGSILVVENLDRLSRDTIDIALTQFMMIIRAGIDIVTLQDRRKYNTESLKDPSQLIISITYMARAHEESATKSKRGKSTWKQKKKMARKGVPLTAVCPDWLKLSDDETEYIIESKEAAESINLIFQLKLQGKGAYAIEKELNERKIYKPIPKNKDGSINKRSTSEWRKSYINKILRNPAVHGEYQPCETVLEYSEDLKRKVKRRKPTGESIPDYYPEVVPKKIFSQVNDIFKLNGEFGKGRGGGRNGKFSNIFRNLITCGNCNDASMSYDNKGEYQYLRCYNSGESINKCDSKSIRYDIIEPLLLHFIERLDPNYVLPKNEQKQTELLSLKNNLSSANGALLDIQKKIKNLVDQQELGQEIKERYIARKQDEEKLLEDKKQLINRIDSLENSENNTKKRLHDIDGLIKLITNKKNPDQKDIRAKLSLYLKRLIKNIKITSGMFSHNESDYRKIEIDFRSGISRTILLNDEENILLIEDFKDGQNVTYRLKDGVVLDVDLDDDLRSEKQRISNLKVKKAAFNS